MWASWCWSCYRPRRRKAVASAAAVPASASTVRRHAVAAVDNEDEDGDRACRHCFGSSRASMSHGLALLKTRKGGEGGDDRGGGDGGHCAGSDGSKSGGSISTYRLCWRKHGYQVRFQAIHEVKNQTYHFWRGPTLTGNQRGRVHSTWSAASANRAD